MHRQRRIHKGYTAEGLKLRSLQTCHGNLLMYGTHYTNQAGHRTQGMLEPLPKRNTKTAITSPQTQG